MQGWLNTCKSINATHQINDLGYKNHMIISIDTKKRPLTKIYHTFFDKDKIYLNTVKAIQKNHSN